jgi:hypothetical protein
MSARWCGNCVDAIVLIMTHADPVDDCVGLFDVLMTVLTIVLMC